MIYLAAIWKVLVELLEDFVLEVTVTVTVHKTPGAKLVTLAALVAPVVLAALLEETTVLSAFFLVDTSMVTPSFGKVEVTFTLMACVVDKAATIPE